MLVLFEINFGGCGLFALSKCCGGEQSEGIESYFMISVVIICVFHYLHSHAHKFYCVAYKVCGLGLP